MNRLNLTSLHAHFKAPKVWALLLCLMAPAEPAPAAALHKRPIHYSDLRPEAKEYLRKQGVSRRGFTDFLRSIEKRTAERERAGENDHLIYYLLQSRQFTPLPKIEPALSAHEFVKNLNPAERTQYLDDRSNYLPPVERMPKSVARRIQDFIQSLDRPASDERLAYFKRFLGEGRNPPTTLPQYFYSQYARSMKFLYQKEYLAEEAGSGKGSFLASLYQQRGHSTDTQIEANYAVWTALSVVKGLNPGLQLHRVLIVGPGLEFAPRTDLLDVIPPQSYQPYALADALLGLGFTTPGSLRIHCLDINDRVIQFLMGFSKRDIKKLTIVSSFPKTRRNFPSKDFQDYFEKLGGKIGAEVPVEDLPALRGAYLKKSLLVRRDVADKITAEKMNIMTERYEPSPEYDLVVVTNVFLYFNPSELSLSLTNIHSMMKDGGYLVHNEFRPEFESLSRDLGLEPIQARTLQLSTGSDHPLLDGFVIHKKWF